MQMNVTDTSYCDFVETGDLFCECKLPDTDFILKQLHLAEFFLPCHSTRIM